MDSPDTGSRAGSAPGSPRTPPARILVPAIVVAVLVVVALWVAIVALRPLPPRTVTMATGPEGGAYHEVGKRYRDLLAREGIELELLPTAGALENLARLRDPRSGVELALLQSGITSGKESPDLESLGTVFYEPLWFFARGGLRGERLEGLRGRTISIGPEGSGTRALALELLARNGIDERFATLLPLTPQESGERLVRGEIDAALMLTSWDSPVVRRLLVEEGIELASFPRADAYVALYPFLSKLTVPAGVGDLASNRPPADVSLFAPKASLVVRRDLHPAIQYLLLEAAEEIHSGPGIFHRARQFPAAESIDLPLSDEARQFYRSGRPFLQRHLPLWLAVLIGQLLILLIPLIGLIYPLFRLTPALYAWQIQWRIFRMYGELRLLEGELETLRAGQRRDDLNERLDRLEEKTSRLRVPVFYANLLYTLRMHIAVVRERLRRTEGASAGG
jgi:TRAP transporter TAXI family solute receptor